MTPSEFKSWRKAHGLKQKEAAEMLGLKKRVIQYYEKGKRDGKNVEIPKSVELACFAISVGVTDFNGQLAPDTLQNVEAPAANLAHEGHAAE